MSWLKNAIHQAIKPKHSVIGVLKQQLGGMEPGRSMDVVHASDVTKPEFCPRQWALFDLFDKDPSQDFVPTAMDVTYRLGTETERLLVEDWGGESVIGNWICRHCQVTRSMSPHPEGRCASGKHHWWEYCQVIVESKEYGIQGSLDSLFNLGAPQLFIVEVKTLNPKEFEDILVPQPEHRLRTNLYMWIVEHSQHPYRDKINTKEARVLYVSRSYGKMNPDWEEILPFKEFIVKRNDGDLQEFLKRAMGLKTFREQGLMPFGICLTALDKTAKKCSVCQQCFSGQYPAGKYPTAPET
jgi:hypothetical protein